MRLTVGPLPSAVYWRRRAVVLGAGLLFLLVVFYSCNGPDSGASPKGKASSTPSATPKPTAVLTPETESPPPPDSGDSEVPASTNSPATVPSAQAAGGDTCADTEISVIPVPVPASVKRGATVDLRLKIKNISSRTCSRDVGADLQEINIRLGAKMVWSSDTCSNIRNKDVESLTPAIEHEYRVAWNGHDASRCANGVADGPVPGAGEYQVFGRLGTKLSDPVKLTLTG
jgi:hypothetical protein